MSNDAHLNIKCPKCGTMWELDAEEGQKPDFKCGSCGVMFDVQSSRVEEDADFVHAPAQLSEIIIVVIRLYAIYMGVVSLNLVFSFLGRSYYGERNWTLNAIIFGVYIFFVILLWMVAPFISRRVSRGVDSYLDFRGLSLEDLYCFAFLLTGLYFAVENFAPSLTWFHYSMIKSASDAALSPQQQTNFYALFSYLVKLILGISMVFGGRNFAKKLLRHQSKQQ